MHLMLDIRIGTTVGDVRIRVLRLQENKIDVKKLIQHLNTESKR